MIKKASVVLCALVLTFFLGGQANAQELQLGEYCWQKTPYVDILKLAVTQHGNQYELHGSQFSSDYNLPFTGNAYSTSEGIVMGGFFAHDGTSFGGSTGLSAIGVLDGSLTGPFTMKGLDAPWGPSTCTLVPIPCPPGPTADTPGAREGE
jgi:hypothetical protein